MCFSAPASFIAAAVIATAGVIAITKAKTTPQRVFAIIPLLFAVQQCIEGFLWIIIDKSDYGGLKHVLINGFLFFAWLIWPVYVPVSMALLEKNKKNKKVLLIFLGIGILLFFCFLYIMLFQHSDASAARLHIKYTLDYIPPLPWIWGLIYLIPTVVSMFISSISKMWLLGLINLASYIFSIIYFSGHVLSVWCFFGALTSVFVLFYTIRMANPAKPVTPNDISS